MPQELSRSLQTWGARVERSLLSFFDATLALATLMAAGLIYTLLAADLTPRSALVAETLALACAAYALLRRVVQAHHETEPSVYVRHHRFGATIALLVPIYFILRVLIQIVDHSIIEVDRTVELCEWLGQALLILILVDLFSSGSYRVLVFLARHLHVPPPLLIVVSFAIVISFGTIFLMSPRATPPDKPIGFVDALFTATSATCVTGLAVRDTGTEFTPFGHVVLLILIQIGGLGLMTFASFFSMFLGQGLGIKEGLVLRDALNLESLSRARPLLYFILQATFVIELSGAVLIYFALGPYWRPELSLAERAWASLFHSVSAFCNAGFSTFPRELIVEGASLEAFTGVWSVLGVFSILIILGGLGFLVMLGLVDSRGRRASPARLAFHRILRKALRGLRTLTPRPLRLFLLRAYSAERKPSLGPSALPPQRANVHSVIVYWTTAALLLLGSLGIYIFEAGSPLFARMTQSEAIATACFQSVSTRTAGFNSVPYSASATLRCRKNATLQPRTFPIGNRKPGDFVPCPHCGELRVLTNEEYRAGLSDASLFLMISLMFVGASPGSTGGGAKTVTVALLLLAVLAILRKREDIEIRDRSLAPDSVTNATVVVVLAFLACSSVTLLLTWTERGLGPCSGDWRFIDLLFESVSAVATVGLSTGVTGALSTAGRLLITAAMFFGRIGPLTLVLSLAVSRELSPRRYSYPRTSVMIG